MEAAKFFRSRAITWIVVGIVEIIIILLAFRAGMLVGFHKADFSFRWGANYHQLFGGPPGGFFPPPGPGFIGQFDRDDYISDHGVAGSVIKIDTSTIIVKTKNNTEQSLSISPNTTIRRGGTNIKISDLKVNDQVVAIGSPSTSGQIEVNFIRVFQP